MRHPLSAIFAEAFARLVESGMIGQALDPQH
jgi:hypothetical protein